MARLNIAWNGMSQDAILFGTTSGLSTSSSPYVVLGTGPIITVNHNLGYIPIIQVQDIDTGQLVGALVTHISTNQLIVAVFGTPNLRAIYR